MSRPIEQLQRGVTSYTLAPPREPDAEAGPSFWSRSWANAHDKILLVAIFVMLIWPWIFLGVVWHLKGVETTNHFTTVVTNNPHGVTFFVTLLGNIVSVVVSILFSFAIIRYAQEWVTAKKEDVNVFHISVLSALRHQHWPWTVKELQDLVFIRAKWLPMVLVSTCIVAFTFVPSSTTSLITPAPFNRNTTLTGTELNFSSTAADCLEWFDTNNPSNNCDWTTIEGLQYTTCLGENQMVDVLESGRGNILSTILNSSDSLALSQLGVNNSMHFLGPIRGILPMGPNGVPPFNTLQSSPLDTNRGKISYNYTLDYQGFASNISCNYDQQSPVLVSFLTDNTRVLVVNSSCDGQAQVLTNVTSLFIPDGDNNLAFWACQSVPTAGKESTYYVYLRGLASYKTSIGNITCSISPIRPAIFPVEYKSTLGAFSSKEQVATSPNTFPGFIELALVALSGVFSEAQNFDANLVAESVITFGVKSFGLTDNKQDLRYLPLYEAMIQGIIEYEMTYIRLIYSTVANPPKSCLRTVTGSVSYRVLGWYAKADNIGYLMPMTLVNLASLGILIRAMYHAKGGGYKFNPLKPNELLSASPDVEEGKTIDWEDKVKYRREVMMTSVMKGVENMKKPAGALAGDVASDVVGVF